MKNADGLAWKLHRNRTSAQYADAFKTYADQGLRSIVVDSARTDGGQRYAGIWIENRNKRGWYAYRDMTATGFRNQWNRLADMGYRLDGYEKYDTASGARYAGIWRQNSDRPNWSLRSKVDGFVQKELDDFDVPGISVTASVNGKVVYRRGFGFQDKADGVWMHGGSVNRTASVSKAVAGVLALRMDAKHPEFSLADKVRTHLPWLPAKHDYTMAQAVMNRSCVKSYPSPMSSQNATQYDTSADSVKAFMADDLGCTPGSYLYSTHAYEVPGAIFEKFEGKPINRIVLDELTTKFGLNTLRPETLAAGLADRVQLYNTDNSEYAGDNMSNKTLGGGLVSTAPDLVSFANKILDGTILNAAQRTTLWSPIGSYAYGWDVSTGPGGERLVGKAGGQPGAKSYLRVYPDDGIVVAVLSNRWKGGHSAAGLSKKIGEAMLAGLTHALPPAFRAAASSTNQSSADGFASESRLAACSGGVPARIRLTGTSRILPDSVRGTSATAKTSSGTWRGEQSSRTRRAIARRRSSSSAAPSRSTTNSAIQFSAPSRGTSTTSASTISSSDSTAL